MSYIVYKHTNKTTKKSYVGWTSKTIEERWRKHVACALNAKYHFHRAIAKYGIDDWDSIVLEVFSTQEEALLSEQKWIKKLNSNDHDFGYNSTSGGEHPTINDSVRNKLSISQRKRYENPDERLKISLAVQKRDPITNETRKKLSEQKLGEKNPQFGKKGILSPRFGKKHSKITKEKIAQKKLGQKLSDDAKKKCSIASKKRWEQWRKERSDIV